MKVIITEFFEKKFKKECKDIDIDFMLKKIITESKNFISFKEPFFKVKIRTKTKSYRLIVNFEEDIFKMLFINIFDKKDKVLWENVTRYLHKDLILKYYEKNLDDIEEWKYTIYDI